MLRHVRELGIGFVAYSPLGRGFLTGEIKKRRRSRRRTIGGAACRAFGASTSSSNLALVEEVEKLAARERLHAGAARARLGARARRRHRADSRHQEAEISGRECRRARGDAEQGRSRPDRCAAIGRRRCPARAIRKRMNAGDKSLNASLLALDARRPEARQAWPWPPRLRSCISRVSAAR